MDDEGKPVEDLTLVIGRAEAVVDESLVLDSSALVALLTDAGPAGDWVATATAGAVLAAPELALFEAANILRRHQLTGALTSLEATLAHDDLRALPVQVWPYLPLASGCGRLGERDRLRRLLCRARRAARHLSHHSRHPAGTRQRSTLPGPDSSRLSPRPAAVGFGSCGRGCQSWSSKSTT